MENSQNYFKTDRERSAENLINSGFRIKNLNQFRNANTENSTDALSLINSQQKDDVNKVKTKKSYRD